jgi:hypothetical protein
MKTNSLHAAVRDERGIALPMAMIVLVSLTALSMALITLAQTEPTIAANLQQSAQARAHAESGVTRAVWALTNPTAPGGLVDTPADALTPYNGDTFFTVGTTGGFTVRVTAGASAQERTITSVGWTPNNSSTSNTHRKVQVTLSKPPGFLDPPCAVCVAGDLQVGGNATIDSRNAGCGGGLPPSTAVQSTGTTTRQGNASSIYGYGNNTKNEVTDYAQNTGSSSAFTYTQDELNQLKEMAKANGTYYQGAQSSIPTTGGVIFIDTVDGSNFTSSTPDSNAGSLTLSGNGTYTGIIVVAGAISLSGTVTINGLVYSMNDLTLGGNVTINGAIATENRKDTASTTVDSDVTGSVTVNFNCQNVRDGGGTVNLTQWTVKNGSWLETSGY